MSSESKQIEANATATIAELEIEYSVIYIGERKRDDWNCDAWSVTFKNKDKAFSTEYYTGLGHRQIKKSAFFDSSIKWRKVDTMQYEPICNKDSMYYINWAKQNLIPVKPPAAGVLHSLCMDSQALAMSFDDWANEYGYDSDSLKALNTYQACCKIAKDMLQVFTRKDIKALNELLQDY